MLKDGGEYGLDKKKGDRGDQYAPGFSPDQITACGRAFQPFVMKACTI